MSLLAVRPPPAPPLAKGPGLAKAKPRGGQAKVAAEPVLERHPSERYDVVRIRRSAIALARYNPRTITEQARKRLKGVLEELGSLGPLNWNKRSGTLVGGHQRLRILDQLAPKGDYLLDVAACDLSPEEEIAANVALNNPEAQGEYDLDKLGPILKGQGFNPKAAGMGSADIFKIIGSEASSEVLADCAERIEKAREIAHATRQAAEDRNSPDYYLVVVFKDHAARVAFTEACGLDDNRYVSAEDVASLLTKRPDAALELERGD